MEEAADHHELRLYVSGSTPRSLRAIHNIRRFCGLYLAGRHALEVIDIYQSPPTAQIAQVVAVPMLLRLRPLPQRRVIGDLSDTARLLAAFDVNPANGGAGAG